MSDILTAPIEAGLRIERFRVHDSRVWRVFDNLVKRGRQDYAWPDKPRLPPLFPLRALKA